MRSNHKIAVAMLAGIAIGALAVQGLHAQVKAPVYYISEIDVTNPDAYAKEYARKLKPSLRQLADVSSLLEELPAIWRET